MASYTSSSSHVVTTGTSANQLIPNQIYKICPPTSGEDDGAGGSSTNGFGQPICGDSTPFCFYFVRPPQRYHGNGKLLIELMGGGACWDYETCEKQSSYLTIPEGFDDFLGYSCSEIQQGGRGGDGNNGQPINMLCGTSLGETDFTSYNTIIVPYCTQDVHVGSNTMSYDGGNSVVHHTGANNVMSVMEWVYRNFPHLRHAAVTGCSAGGTAVPTVYALMDNHYNHFGMRNTQISAITDSPVYLTPTYFLENALSNWKPERLLKLIGVPYNRYKTSEDYPTLTWDYILRKSSNKNRWGFVSHTSDPVSLAYYQWMSGSNAHDDDRRRRLDEDGDEAQWYDELTASIGTIQRKHKNVQSYWIDGEGHCSFGLYYALQEGSDFEKWAGRIVKEDALAMSMKSPVNTFLVSMAIGFAMVAAILFSNRHRSKCGHDIDSTSTSNKDGLLKNETKRYEKSYVMTVLTEFLAKLGPYPVTAGYAVIATIYFWSMVISQGFAHAINNPSLGPNAVGLSSFGINNPSLIILQHQWYRLLTSNFVCSGVITFCIAMYNLWFRTRHFERRLTQDTSSGPTPSFSLLFLILAVLIGITTNVLYCFVPINQQGASCSSVALVMGVQACNLYTYWKETSRRSIAGLAFEFIFVSILLPFNSWIMMLAAIVIGPLAMLLIQRAHPDLLQPPNEDAPADGTGSTPSDRRSLYAISRKVALVCIFTFCLVPVFGRLARPNSLYVEPFYTGCKLFYSSEVAELESYSFGKSDDDDKNAQNKNEGRRELRWSRWLEEGDFDYDDACAQFCVPHIATPIVKRFTSSRGIPIQLGQCLDQGYETHVVDKTFNFLSYSLDVELYQANNYNS